MQKKHYLCKNCPELKRGHRTPYCPKVKNKQTKIVNNKNLVAPNLNKNDSENTIMPYNPWNEEDFNNCKPIGAFAMHSDMECLPHLSSEAAIVASEKTQGDLQSGGMGTCGQCNKKIKYGALLFNEKTKTYAWVGEECSSQYSLNELEKDFASLRGMNSLASRRLDEIERRNAWNDKHSIDPDLFKQESDKNGFINSLYKQFLKKGYLSEKQTLMLKKHLENLDKTEEQKEFEFFSENPFLKEIKEIDNTQAKSLYESIKTNARLSEKQKMFAHQLIQDHKTAKALGELKKEEVKEGKSQNTFIVHSIKEELDRFGNGGTITKMKLIGSDGKTYYSTMPRNMKKQDGGKGFISKAVVISGDVKQKEQYGLIKRPRFEGNLEELSPEDLEQIEHRIEKTERTKNNKEEKEKKEKEAMWNSENFKTVRELLNSENTSNKGIKVLLALLQTEDQNAVNNFFEEIYDELSWKDKTEANAFLYKVGVGHPRKDINYALPQVTLIDIVESSEKIQANSQEFTKQALELVIRMKMNDSVEKITALEKMLPEEHANVLYDIASSYIPLDDFKKALSIKNTPRLRKAAIKSRQIKRWFDRETKVK